LEPGTHEKKGYLKAIERRVDLLARR
jgi:hypothetical protein